MKKSLLAATIIASTLSAPLFAMAPIMGHEFDSHDDVTVNLDLPDIVLVEMEKEEITFTEGTLDIDRLEAFAHLHIRMRGASEDTPRKYQITVSNISGGEVSNDDGFLLHHENPEHPSIGMEVGFYPKRGGFGVPIEEPGVAKPHESFVTSNGIFPGPVTTFDSKLLFMIDSEDHLNYMPGKYSGQIRLMVEAG